MKTVKLSNEQLLSWLAAWQQDYPVYAPQPKQRTAQGDRDNIKIYDWALWTDDELPTLPTGVVKNSIKRFYLPQPQTMGIFKADKREDDSFIIQQTLPDVDKKQIIFGARPCDGRAVLLKNQILATDPYFQAAREKNILVGVTCEQQAPTCFCHETGASPLAFIGLDIALTRLADGWLAELVTPRGEELAGESGDATDADLAELKGKREAVNQSSPASAFKDRDMMEMYEAPLWQSYSDRCISCGTCTFLCPTCTCFDIQDETKGSTGRRIRIWDSCMTPLFTAHTSGHNPRGSKLSRVRQRFMHKLKYYPDQYGPLYCVGCGRCVKDCPTNIDIRAVISDLSGNR